MLDPQSVLLELRRPASPGKQCHVFPRAEQIVGQIAAKHACTEYQNFHPEAPYLKIQNLLLFSQQLACANINALKKPPSAAISFLISYIIVYHPRRGKTISLPNSSRELHKTTTPGSVTAAISCNPPKSTLYLVQSFNALAVYALGPCGCRYAAWS